MKINDIAKVLNAEILIDFSNEDNDIIYGFASDLMSDVLAYANSESLLVTGLNNAQVIRTAEMLDMSTVLFVRGKMPCKEVLDLSRENSITVLKTNYSMFQTCGILVTNGMKGLESND